MLPRDHDLLPEYDNEVVLDAIRQLPNLRYVWLNPRYHSNDAWKRAQRHPSSQTKGLDRFITNLKRCGNTSNRGLRGLYFRCPLSRARDSSMFFRTTEADESKEMHLNKSFTTYFNETDHLSAVSRATVTGPHTWSLASRAL